MSATTEIILVLMSSIVVFTIAYALGNRKAPPSKHIEPLELKPAVSRSALDPRDPIQDRVQALEKQLAKATKDQIKLKGTVKALELEKEKLQKQLEECSEARLGVVTQSTQSQERMEHLALKQDKFSVTIPEPVPIVTRTTSNPSIKTFDTWTGERDWTQDELRRLLALYKAGGTVQSMAIAMNIDAIDIVYRIARSVFNCTGELEDLNTAPNNGKSWSKADREKMHKRLDAQVPISEIAFGLGRTQVAIVWQAIDRR